MKVLTQLEVDEHIEKGAGFLSFMGGFETRNGYNILVVKGEYYLFSEDEVGGKEWEDILELQNQEAQEWCEFQIKGTYK